MSKYRIHAIEDGWIIIEGMKPVESAAELKARIFLRGTDRTKQWAVGFHDYLNSPQGNVPEETNPPSENGET